MERFNSGGRGKPDLTITFSPDSAFTSRIDDMGALASAAEYRCGLLYARIRYTDEGGYLWFFGKETLDTLAFLTSPDWRKLELLFDITGTGGEFAYYYLFEVLICALISLGGLILHGVLLDYLGKGIVISAPSGTGKTTHARLWRDSGSASIINGDKSLCRNRDGVWTGFGMPWCGTSGESENRQVPLMAIVVLEQAEENALTRLNAADALFHLLTNIHVPRWEPTLYNKALDRLDEIIPEIPVYLLRCRPDLDAVMTLKREMDRLLEAGGKA